LSSKAPPASDGGAPDLLHALAQRYIRPGATFPPMPDPPPGFILGVTPRKVRGMGPWGTTYWAPAVTDSRNTKGNDTQGETRMEGCEICENMPNMRPENPYFVAEMETGHLVLAWNQYVPGYAIFISKTHVRELHELPRDLRSRFVNEMAVAAEAVFRAFEPRKLNYEPLGNSWRTCTGTSSRATQTIRIRRGRYGATRRSSRSRA